MLLSPPQSVVRRAAAWLSSELRRLELATRPVHPETVEALRSRWEALPEAARTDAQLLGRNAVGCEGTHGVFPRCNLACRPCYHSRDANRVRIDGPHTLARVTEQMALLRRLRGPRAHAQLIGGEVSLLPPDDHAAALTAMQEAGREPMSMTHGDFDADHLRAIALDEHGRRRFAKLSFAAHFDMLMYGRRGIERPDDEAALDPYRRRFTQMFADLRREHGVRSFLAHNMTVTERNVEQIPGVLRANRTSGFGMFSFQPAAFVGDERRWPEASEAPDGNRVWAEVERGVGHRLPFRALQHGDERCNRTTYGFYVGEHYQPLLDDTDPRDLALRDAVLAHLGGVQKIGGAGSFVAKIARVLVAHPSLVAAFLGWFARTVAAVGPLALVRHGVRPVTFVMHSFIDADVVGPAWAGLQAGEPSAEPEVAAAQERLRACSYAMAHPETGELVPACVQHAVLDPVENVALRRLLPLTPVRRG